MHIFKDMAYALKKLHNKNLLCLGLKPSNVMYVEAHKCYVIGDCVLNEPTLRFLHNEEVKERESKFSEFKELGGKVEHNVCVFDGKYETDCEVTYPLNITNIIRRFT